MPKEKGLRLLTASQKKNRKRILEISYHKRLSHLGSCLSAVDLIDSVYEIKNEEDKFVLSNGHAGIALYTVLEKFNLLKSGEVENLHVHPDRNYRFGIDVSTGSLGQGLPIALGMAMASPQKNIYCLISDGECAEGSIWESLRIAIDRNIRNLKIIINANGWGAYDQINTDTLKIRLQGFGYKISQVDGHNQHQILNAMKKQLEKSHVIIFARTNVEQFPFLKGQDAHYYVMNDNDYNLALSYLK